MKDIKWIYIFLLCSFVAHSQLDSAFVRKASPKVLKRMGNNAFAQKDPASAIIYYEFYVQKTDSASLDPKATNNMAKAYMQVRDYKHAQDMFLKTYKINKEKYPEALYYHAQMQKSNSLYDSAKVNFDIFRKEYKGENKALKKQAAKEVVFCDSLAGIMKIDNKIVVKHLDSSINKVNTEGAPLNLDDNSMIFTSLRTDKQEYILENDTAKTKVKKIYRAVRKGEEEPWTFAGEYGGEILNDEDFNTGNACFSPDGKRIYFTRCKRNGQEKMICAIYMAEKIGDTWSDPVKLPQEINNPKYTSTMPAITKDPQKGGDIIYFVSDNKNGKGGMDIWFSVYDKKKKIYKEAKNAGNKINTSRNEITPFFDNETRTMYFSSDGRGGLGGFDIFRATGDGKRWLSAENVGIPYNSGADDMYFTISPNREEGFLVSNREGGVALKNSTCCDDIYQYRLTDYIKIKLAGKIRDAETKEILPNSVIGIYIKDSKTGERIFIKAVTADNEGNYQTRLEAGRDYIFIAKKKDYLSSSSDLSTQTIAVSTDLTKELVLTKKPKGSIRIPNIQYEFGKAKLVEESKAILDTTILKLMMDNPELIVQIESHTDSKGSDQFNMKLSQERAESVVAYLIGKGIDPMQLEAKGFGEVMPIAPNENKDGSDNPDGRAKNRRTEFKIVGELEGVDIIREE